MQTMADLSTNQVSAQTSPRLSKLPSLPQLYYEHSSGWAPLPYWGQFFLEVGAQVARHPIGPYRCILGCAIPTKAYAAAFTATGVVTSLALANQFTPSDEAAHAEWLRHLEPGTPLIYRSGNKYAKGVLDRWHLDNGIQYMRIKTSGSGKEAISVPPKLLLGVDLLHDATFRLPHKQTMRGIVSKEELDFVSVYLGNRLARELIAYSRLDCLVIGSKGQIRREAHDTRFAINHTSSRFVEGSLNMLVRIRELLGDNSAHRTALCSSSSLPEDQVSITNAPVVVIFSGAASFLRWRDSWRSSHWIVLLDRTEPHFDEAVAELNQEYILRRVEEKLFEPLPTLPEGIETVWYHEEL